MDEKKQHKIFHLYAAKSDQGLISGQFETANSDPGTVSPGKLHNGAPDPGGISYGTYQFTSQDIDRHHHVVHNGGTVERFLNSAEGRPFRDEFKDAKGQALDPQSKEFGEKWKEVANNQRDEFAAAQQSFVGTHYYNPQADRLQGAGVDLENRSTTLQNVVWSTSVQHGASNPLMADAVREKAENLHMPVSKLSDEQCIDAIYDKRMEAYPTDARRYRDEKTYAKHMLHAEEAQSHQLSPHMHGAEQSLAPAPPSMSRVAAGEAMDFTNAAAQTVAGAPFSFAQVPEEISKVLSPELKDADSTAKKADLTPEHHFAKLEEETTGRPQDTLYQFNPLPFRVGNS